MCIRDRYHPTGVAYPVQMLGALVTEKVRSVGAQLVNAEGKAYIHQMCIRDRCQGCGACTVACPSGAMDLQGFSNRQIIAEVYAICQ